MYLIRLFWADGSHLDISAGEWPSAACLRERARLWGREPDFVRADIALPK